MTEFTELQKEAWEIAEQNGFHDDERSKAKVLALIHSEVSEALEADREGDAEAYWVEMADIIIRVMDHAKAYDVSLESYIEAKMEKNRSREYKHGKNY